MRQKLLIAKICSEGVRSARDQQGTNEVAKVDREESFKPSKKNNNGPIISYIYPNLRDTPTWSAIASVNLGIY